MPSEPEEPQPLTEVPEIIPEVVSDNDTSEEPELPEIPVIEADFYQPDSPNDIQEIDGGLPDIPVITPDDNDNADDFTESFIDEAPSDDNDTANDDEPVQEMQTDFQETELFEAPETDDEFADIDETPEEFTDDFSDEPIDEEPAPLEPEIDSEDAPPYDLDNDEAGIFADDDTDEPPEEFSPAADVVLNVDDELPQISARDEPETDPEAESAPVTVTMPESTRTAEDKLMADIAEAMTGSPLNLGAQEQPGLYPLPEDFFSNDSAANDSQQSAEDKLKANIAQALSESPINTAQDNASQSLEQDINPFDDLSVPDSLFQRSDDTEQEQTEEDTPPSETLINEPGEQSANIEDDEFLPDFTAEQDNDTEQEAPPQDDASDDPNDPFTLPDFGDDDTETETFTDIEPETFTEDESEPEPEPELLPEDDTVPEPEAFPEAESVPETEPEPEPELVPEIPADDMPFPADDETTPEDILPPSEPLTEQARLEQEIAAMTQELEPETDTDIPQKEAEPDNDMPEQTLLNDDAQETAANDDWDISALGELGAAATIPGDDPDDFHAEPETVTEMITQPENVSDMAGIAGSPEIDHKEKTMNIREKLTERKKGNSDGSSAGKVAGIILPLLLTAIAIIGGLMLWQIMTLSDKISSLAMNGPAFDSSAGFEATPSYAYAIDFILDPNLTDRMAQRGRDGWQVVGSRRTQDSTTGQYGYEFIFMRRVPGR